jgi:HPt (histidine-containing phosphotransfer) domain-containing protein
MKEATEYLSTIIDLEDCLKRFDSIEFLSEMLFLFQKNYNTFPDTIQKLMLENNTKEIYSQIHKIKGVIGSFSFLSMKNLIQLSDDIKLNDRVDRLEMELFLSELKMTFQFLNQFFEKFPNFNPK